MKTFLSSFSVLVWTVLAPRAAQAALIDPSRDRPSDVPAGTDIRQTVVRIINYALSFVGLIAVAMLIYAGFIYLFAGAGADTAKAKDTIVNVIIGIIIILLSFVIVNTVIAQFSGVVTSGNPGTGA